MIRKYKRKVLEMKRVQFELQDERAKELDQLVDKTGLKTRVRLLNEALTLYEWAINERESGRIIASVDETRDSYKEILMAGFPKIAKEPGPGDIMAPFIKWLNSLIPVMEKQIEAVQPVIPDEEYIALVNYFSEERFNPQTSGILTNQELEILKLVSEGHSLQETAASLTLPISRVRVLILKMVGKLQENYTKDKERKR
jgi:ATP/maltotriose-dependent transcriptional regulator MalT